MACTSASRTLGSLKNCLPSPSMLNVTNEFVNIRDSCTTRSFRANSVSTSCGWIPPTRSAAPVSTARIADCGSDAGYVRSTR